MLVCVGVGLPDEVDACVGAVAGEGGVAPFAVDRAGGQDPGSVDACALGFVAGDGVAVGDRACPEVGAVKSSRTVVGVDGDRCGVRVDG